MSRPTIHLVSFATRRFLPRQWLLGASALANRVADRFVRWSPEELVKQGFPARVPGIGLNERGAGFWAWKPFVILDCLARVNEGDLVFYCDVGRLYPFKQLDAPITPFLDWMEQHRTDVMPGIEIPWTGTMDEWTKREAFVGMEMDHPSNHSAAPIQASFSIWRAGPAARGLCQAWMDACARRAWVSDDPSRPGLPELPRFREHRHDQSLLTLCCLKSGIPGLATGRELDAATSRHPSEVARLLANDPGFRTESLRGKLLRHASRPVEWMEQMIRRAVPFSEPRVIPDRVADSPGQS